MLHWVYSKVKYFEEYLMRWDDTLIKDINEKELIESYIKNLESPFGFLETLETQRREDQEDEVHHHNGTTAHH
jgi:hypothetical protein